MLEIGSRWVKKVPDWRGVARVAEIVVAQQEGEEVVFYRLDNQWTLYTEEQLRADYLPVLSTQGESFGEREE